MLFPITIADVNVYSNITLSIPGLYIIALSKSNTRMIDMWYAALGSLMHSTKTFEILVSNYRTLSDTVMRKVNHTASIGNVGY